LSRASLTFIGTATTLLRLGGFTLLTDPNFLHRGQRAYLGKGMWSRRRIEPALQPDQLPELDAVVLSHLHGDHFDRVARRGLDKSLPVVTTTQAARRLRRWGFAETVPLQPWDTTELTTTADGGQRLRICHCRKGGSVFVLGVFAGLVDKFPLGAVMNKGLTLRGAQMHGQRYIPMLLDRMARGELVTEYLATHAMSLDRAREGYHLFKNKLDGCVRAVFTP
jgi:hypothetical protein